jgi:hypothetical protein
MKYKIDLTCDEWYVADSLHELGARIENDDLLDDMQDGRVTVNGDHYTAEITEINEEESTRKESFPITSVSRGDLDAKGFDTSEVDDATMERLASKMADDYCEQLFWSSMEIIAEYMDIPKKVDLPPDFLPDYSEHYRKGIAYVMEQLDEDDKAIIRAECNKAYKMHLVPNGDVVGDSKITDLLEEYGQDHDLPEGWYEEEYDSSEILTML